MNLLSLTMLSDQCFFAVWCWDYWCAVGGKRSEFRGCFGWFCGGFLGRVGGGGGVGWILVVWEFEEEKILCGYEEDVLLLNVN